MPGVYRQASLGSTIQQALQRIRALETQQQMILSNLQGLSVMAFGLIPGSNPQRYGLESVDPNTGGPLAFLGYDSGDDTAKMQFLNSAGQLTLQIDAAGVHFYNTADGNELVLINSNGIQVLNDSGAEEVLLGLLGDGTYGLEVLDPGGSGHFLKLFSPVSATVATTESTTSTTFTDLATPGPEVSFTVGPSGQAFVLASANMNPNANAGGESGYLGLVVDGAPAYGIATASLSIEENLAVPGATIQTLPLTPGVHTAKMQYAASSGTTVAFYYRSLLVFTY